jgi:hypothetical protein
VSGALVGVAVGFLVGVGVSFEAIFAGVGVFVATVLDGFDLHVLVAGSQYADAQSLLVAQPLPLPTFSPPVSVIPARLRTSASCCCWET